MVWDMLAGVVGVRPILGVVCVGRVRVTHFVQGHKGSFGQAVPHWGRAWLACSNGLMHVRTRLHSVCLCVCPRCVWPSCPPVSVLATASVDWWLCLTQVLVCGHVLPGRAVLPLPCHSRATQMHQARQKQCDRSSARRRTGYTWSTDHLRGYLRLSGGCGEVCGAQTFGQPSSI